MKSLYCSLGRLLPYSFYLFIIYFLLLCWRPARAQGAYEVVGRVISVEDQAPLTGASVQVKGAMVGTTTDKNGNFRLALNGSRAALIVSFIGYRSLDSLIALPQTRELTLVLHQNLDMLNEVKVSTGYWDSSRRLSTGNISQLNAEKIEMQPVSNPLAAMIGRMAGVYVQQQTGVPGGGFNVQIRGRNSLRNDGNEPLYIVDGVPFSSTPLSYSGASASILTQASPLNNINPANIERIQILKDADATAIYGSRGANGVVLITTKNPSKGKARFELDFYHGYGKAAQRMDLLTTSQYLQMRKEALRNDGATAGISNPDYDLLKWDQTKYTDWQKVLIGGSAPVTSLQANVSAGNDQTQFLLGSGFFQEGTVFPGAFKSNKGSVQLKVNHLSSDRKLSMNISASVVAANSSLPREDLTTQGVNLPPNAPDLLTASGELNWADNSWPSSHPIAYLKRKYESKTSTLVSNAVLSYNLLPGLKLITSLGYTAMRMDELSTLPIGANNPVFKSTGSNYFSNSGINTWIAEPKVSYQTRAGHGQFSAMLGLTFQDSRREGKTLNGSGYSSDVFIESIQAAPTVTASSSYQQYRYSAIYARVNYDCKDKYLLNLTARRDGSSRFGPGKRFGNFGAIGAGWLFSEEQLIKSALPQFSTGKIRGSFGLVGSDQIADYGFLDTYTTTTAYQGYSSIYPTRLANTDYSWESTRKLEMGIELGFFKDRVFTEVSWYRNKSSNQLVGYPLPVTTGFSTIQYNLPATVENRGLEVVIDFLSVQNTTLNWKTSINVTFPRNRLVAYPDLKSSTYANTYEVGKSLFTRKLYEFAGVDPQKGIFTVADLSGDGNISYPLDLKAGKTASQNFYGGLGNTLKYKFIELDVFFQFVKQNGYNFMNGGFNLPGTLGNQPAVIMDRWQKDGDKNVTAQKFTQDYGSAAFTGYANNLNSDNIISDASFVRLKNVSLTFQMPARWQKVVHAASCQVFLRGQNLLTFTKFNGLDPEAQRITSLPPLKMLTAGFKIIL